MVNTLMPGGCHENTSWLNLTVRRQRLVGSRFCQVTAHHSAWLEVDFSQCQVNWTDFDHSRWFGTVAPLSHWSEVSLNSGSFSHSEFRYNWFTNCLFVNSQFDHCDFTGTWFAGCDFTGVEIQGCDLSGVGFLDCVFSEPTLTWWLLTGQIQQSQLSRSSTSA